MNSSEYLTWTKHAVGAFPAIHRVLDGSGEGRQRSRQWLAALATVKLQHATNAIDAMLRGDIDTPKYDWAELPAYVIRYCNDQCNAEAAVRTERYYDGPTVKCPHCRDSRSGYISVWNPEFLSMCDQAILACNNLFEIHKVFEEWKYAGERRRYETLAMVCCCDSPAAVAKRADEKGAPVFNPKRHCYAHSVIGVHEFLRDETRIEFDPNEWN